MWEPVHFNFTLEFMLRLKNPSLLDIVFSDFLVMGLWNFISGNEDEMLCPLRTIIYCQCRAKQQYPGCKNFLIFTQLCKGVD